LTRDPASRTTPGGQTVCELGLALNRKFRDKAGGEREESLFVDVSVWGKTGEACARCLRKGSQVLVEGRLKMDQWEKDGQKRSKIVVIADNVVFLGEKPRQESADDQRGDGPAADQSNQADIPF